MLTTEQLQKIAMPFDSMSQSDSKQSKDRIIIFWMNKYKSSAFAELFLLPIKPAFATS
ncbi:hypothetical protein [Sporosarcina sp. UB5]|uniref:hypothetical protein n=1 Tax=Sporosarcina sp. UB5 TaxID=3047463 RepID=UPI003D7A6E18